MNEIEFRKYLDVLKPNGELFEIRILDGKKTYSGYFKDSETAYNATKQYENCAIYVTLNRINEACFSREQCNKITQYPKATTSDNDITIKSYILLDFDPHRPSDTNSTDNEIAECGKVANNVYDYIRRMGFSESICTFSGNGHHILIPINIIQSKENDELIKKFLHAIDMMFSTDLIKVDLSVFNGSRIVKVAGTYSRKGTKSNADRPQRLSKIIRVPQEIKPTPKELIEKVASLIPEKEKPTYKNNYGRDEFNLDNFLSKYGIGVKERISFSGGTKYILDHCPFNSNHRQKDAAIFLMNNGAIGFKCFHASDSDKTWQDVRMLYEPNAYDKRDKYDYKPPQFNRNVKEFKPQEQDDEKGDIWLKLSSVKTPQLNEADFIPTGFKEFDKRAIGLMKKHVTIVTGLRGCGKTSILDMIILNASNIGYKTGVFSGELDSGEFRQWLYLMASGRQYNKKKGNTEYYYTPTHIEQKIDSWIDNYVSLYNNAYSNAVKQIEKAIEDKIKEDKLDLVVLDNLLTIDDSELNGDSNEKNKQVLLILTQLAKKYNIHIILVCHPNKSSGLLRLNHVSGSGNITNLAQNVLIFHRVKMNENEYNRDFERDVDDFFGHGTFAKFSMFSNVIEVAKLRSKGSLMGSLFGLYYEKESGRFLNEPYENPIYGWQETCSEQNLDFTNSINNFEPNYDFDNMNYDDDEVPF